MYYSMTGTVFYVLKVENVVDECGNIHDSSYLKLIQNCLEHGNRDDQ